MDVWVYVVVAIWAVLLLIGQSVRYWRYKHPQILTQEEKDKRRERIYYNAFKRWRGM